MDKIRIVCIGCWAGHSKEFARAVKENPECELVGVWDEDETAGRAWAEEEGVPFVTDIYELLRSDRVDAVSVTCGTAKHAPYLIEAAKNGKHIFVEKALAATNEDAYAIREAVKKNNVHFTMTDPVFRGGLRYIKKLADEGTFGELTSARYRTLNDRLLIGKSLETLYDKKENGGGCMIDMGHHCVHVLSWFLGKPVRARALGVPWTRKGKEEAVEELSAAIYEFENKAIGIAESGWLGPKYQFEFNLYGTKGCACAFRRDDEDEKLMVRYHLEDGQWTDVPEELLEEDFMSAMDYWINSIKNDTENTMYGIDEAVRLTEMVVAGYASDQQECRQSFTI